MKKLFALVCLSLLLFGCIGEEEETPTLQPTIGPVIPLASPSPQANASANATPSVAPTATAEPTIEATIAPSPSPAAASCTATVQSLSETSKRAIVQFENFAYSQAEVQCFVNDSWHSIELDLNFQGYYDCEYVQNATAKTYTVTARSTSLSTECETTVTIEATDDTYVLEITPATDSFTIDKSGVNPLTRYYYLNNTGNQPLAGIACYANYNWITPTCVASLAINGSYNSSFSFNASNLGTGVHYATLTVWADEVGNQTIPVTITVEDTAPATASVSLNAPITGKWVNSPTVAFKFTPQSNGGTLESCQLWSDDSGAWIVESTLAAGLVSGSIATISDSCANGNDCAWNVACKNAGTGYTFAAANWFVSVDAVAPTTPANLANGGVTPSTILISWDSATDARSGIANYSIYVGGSLNHTTISPSNTYTIEGLASGTPYSIYVKATDLASNEGGASNTIVVSTA